MRMHSFLWAPDDRKTGHVGTTSGSGGAEEFVSPAVSRAEHLRPPEAEHTPVRAPMETAGDVVVDPTGLDGSEAGPDNPARGTD